MKKKKVFNPPSNKPPKIPDTYSEYILFNPKFSVDTVLTLLSAAKKDVRCLIKGTEADFEGTNEVFRIVKEPITLKKGDTDVNT